MSKRFTITCQEEVKKHLGVTYDWGEDEHGLYAKASMKELEEDIVTCLEEIIGKELKRWPTPGYPGTTLVKGDHVEAVKPEGYQKVVGKTMFWNQKVGVECNNATRELQDTCLIQEITIGKPWKGWEGTSSIYHLTA